MRTTATFTLLLLVLAGCSSADETVPHSPDAATTESSRTPEAKLSHTIPPEERLLYLPVGPTSHFAGRLQPTDRVDILGRFQHESEDPVSMVLLQNVTVLDVERPDESGAARVGLSVTLHELQLLTTARGGGELLFVARHPDDVEIGPVNRRGAHELLGDLEVLQEQRRIRLESRAEKPGRPSKEADRFVSSIPEDERAMAVDHGLPGGVLKAGDRVDIVSAADIEEAGPMSMTLLQNVEVIDVVGEDLAIVAVTIDEAEMLNVARQIGELILAMRPPEDDTISSMSRKTLNHVVDELEVIGAKRQRRLRRPRKKKSGIEIIRGDSGSSPSRRATSPGATSSSRSAASSGRSNTPAVDVAPRPGQLTAGEWRDLEHWGHWRELATESDSKSPDNFSTYSREWGFTTQRIYPVVVRTSSGEFACDAEVVLRHPSTGRAIWTARTDNRGRAWLFDGIGEAKTGGSLEAVARLGTQTESARVDDTEAITRLTIDASAEPNDTLDAMLLVDTTASMSDELEYLQSELQDVLEQVESDHRSVMLRTSVNFYRDENDAYVVRPFDFTSHLSESLNSLRAQRAGGGGDEPEAVDRALHDAVYEHVWSADARARLLFIVLDAPPHGDGAIRFRQTVEEAARRGIRIIPVVGSGMSKRGEYLMRSAAIATGGTYVFLTDDSGIGERHTRPTAGPHDVGYLNDLLTKLIDEWVS